MIIKIWAEIVQLVSGSLRAGRFGDPIPVEARFSAPSQAGPGANTVFCKCVAGLFPGCEVAEACR
jgi:hypothetical protein